MLYITKEECGGHWPFTVDDGYVYSEGPEAIFQTGSFPFKRKYALNGYAEMVGYRSLDSIWRENPSIPGTKIDIGPFIDLALENEK